MKFQEMKDMTVEELKKRLRLTREELFTLGMKHTLGQVDDAIKIRRTRRDVARLMTALNLKLG